MKEVTNIVDDPNVMLIDFDQKYQQIAKRNNYINITKSSKIFPTFQKNVMKL